MKHSLSALAIALCAAAPAMAEDVSVEMSTFKLVEVVAEDGTTTIDRIAPDTVLPGDDILYRVEIANAGEEPATEVALALPVHEAMIVAPQSFASDAEIAVTFATREAPETFAVFAELTVPLADGGARPAQPDDLGAVRVEIAEIAAEGTAFVEYEATVR